MSPFDDNNDDTFPDDDPLGEGVHVMAFTDEDIDAARALAYSRLAIVYGPDEAKIKTNRIPPLALLLAYREALMTAPQA